MVLVLALTVSAETLTPEAVAGLQSEYADANVVLDIYCVGIHNGSGYNLTDAFASLNLSDVDFLDPEDVSALAQDAAKIVFAEGSIAVPVKEAAQLDVTIQDLPLGLYLILPHGSDLTRQQYCKTIRTEDGGEKLVTIARTNTYEYRFSPILFAMDYDNADVEIQIKAEWAERYGRLRIPKKLQAYNSAHPATFVFHVVGEDDAGTVVFETMTGLTLSGTGAGYVDVDHIPVGATVTVTEIYDGSDLTYVSGPDPESVVIESEELTEVTIGASDGTLPAPKQSVTFVNTYDYHEEHGFGFTNQFRYNGSTWEWYKDGVLQTAETGGKE